MSGQMSKLQALKAKLKNNRQQTVKSADSLSDEPLKQSVHKSEKGNHHEKYQKQSTQVHSGTYKLPFMPPPPSLPPPLGPNSAQKCDFSVSTSSISPTCKKPQQNGRKLPPKKESSAPLQPIKDTEHQQDEQEEGQILSSGSGQCAKKVKGQRQGQRQGQNDVMNKKSNINIDGQLLSSLPSASISKQKIQLSKTTSSKIEAHDIIKSTQQNIKSKQRDDKHYQLQTLLEQKKTQQQQQNEEHLHNQQQEMDPKNNKEKRAAQKRLTDQINNVSTGYDNKASVLPDRQKQKKVATDDSKPIAKNSENDEFAIAKCTTQHNPVVQKKLQNQQPSKRFNHIKQQLQKQQQYQKARQSTKRRQSSLQSQEQQPRQTAKNISGIVNSMPMTAQTQLSGEEFSLRIKPVITNLDNGTSLSADSVLMQSHLSVGSDTTAIQSKSKTQNAPIQPSPVATSKSPQKKVVLQELLQIKQAIRNLEAAQKGILILQERCKKDVFLKRRLKDRLQECQTGQQFEQIRKMFLTNNGVAVQLIQKATEQQN